MPELTIYDDIGADFWGDGITATSISRQLADMSGDLTVRINSYGGDVFEGHAIYNILKNYSGNVRTVIDGLAASAASVVAMAGDEVIMPINGVLMIHDPWTFAVGDAAEMTKTASALNLIKQSIVNVYVEKTGLDAEEVSAMMTEETWLDVDQAIEKGFAIKDETRKAVMNKTDGKKWINKIKEPAEEIILFEHPNNDARKRYLEIEAEAC